MTENNSKKLELVKKIKEEHDLFLKNLDNLTAEECRLLKKYRQKLDDLKIRELRKKIK